MTDHPDAPARGMALSDWPGPDRAAWRRALMPFDPFEPSVGRASLWKVTTRRTYEGGYGRFLAFLAWIGELDRAAAPGDRATEAHLRAFHARLKADGLAPYTIAGHLMGLARVLAAMHPERDFSWITRASRRIHGEAAPVRDVTLQFRPLEEIRGLAWRLMWEAQNGVFRGAVDRAILYRDGLLLALVGGPRPLRRSNLAAIRIGEHLRRRGDEWWLSFPASEMKNGRPFECPWPEESAPALELYLAEHRPVLLGSSAEDSFLVDALWISSGRKKPLSRGDVAYRIKKRTGDAFGTPITSHTPRHMVATAIATLRPESAALIAGVLGHASVEAGEESYNKARQIDAAMRYQEALREMRKDEGRRRLRPRS